MLPVVTVTVILSAVLPMCGCCVAHALRFLPPPTMQLWSIAGGNEADGSVVYAAVLSPPPLANTGEHEGMPDDGRSRAEIRQQTALFTSGPGCIIHRVHPRTSETLWSQPVCVSSLDIVRLGFNDTLLLAVGTSAGGYWTSALRWSTGALIWNETAAAQGPAAGRPVGIHLARACDPVVVVAVSKLSGYDVNTGNRLWASAHETMSFSYVAAPAEPSNPAFGNESIVFMQTYDPVAPLSYLLNPRTGETRWLACLPSNEAFVLDPSVGAQMDDGRLVIVPSTSAPVWEVATFNVFSLATEFVVNVTRPAGQRPSTVVRNMSVYLANGVSVDAVDVDSGATMWTVSQSDVPCGTVVVDQATALSVTDDFVGYQCADGYSIYAMQLIDRRSGLLLWSNFTNVSMNTACQMSLFQAPRQETPPSSAPHGRLVAMAMANALLLLNVTANGEPSPGAGPPSWHATTFTGATSLWLHWVDANQVGFVSDDDDDEGDAIGGLVYTTNNYQGYTVGYVNVSHRGNIPMLRTYGAPGFLTVVLPDGFVAAGASYLSRTKANTLSDRPEILWNVSLNLPTNGWCSFVTLLGSRLAVAAANWAFLVELSSGDIVKSFHFHNAGLQYAYATFHVQGDYLYMLTQNYHGSTTAVIWIHSVSVTSGVWIMPASITEGFRAFVPPIAGPASLSSRTTRTSKNHKGGNVSSMAFAVDAYYVIYGIDADSGKIQWQTSQFVNATPFNSAVEIATVALGGGDDEQMLASSMSLLAAINEALYAFGIDSTTEPPVMAWQLNVSSLGPVQVPNVVSSSDLAAFLVGAQAVATSGPRDRCPVVANGHPSHGALQHTTTNCLFTTPGEGRFS